MKVIKRDGRIVEFDATKIERAILAAFQDVDGEITDYAKEKAENIASYIEGYYLDVDETPGIEEIQDLVEKGWFTRGVKLLVAGFRRDDTFVGKTYKNNGFHQLYKITEVYDNGDIKLNHDREGLETE